MHEVNIDRLNRANREIDRMISRRVQEQAAAEREAELWRASCDEYNRRREEARREEWRSYHEDLPELHTQLASEHRLKAMQLADGAFGQPNANSGATRGIAVSPVGYGSRGGSLVWGIGGTSKRALSDAKRRAEAGTTPP